VRLAVRLQVRLARLSAERRCLLRFSLRSLSIAFRGKEIAPVRWKAGPDGRTQRFMTSVRIRLFVSGDSGVDGRAVPNGAGVRPANLFHCRPYVGGWRRL
jgi:hypothetical protein